jgi:maltose alpha-D-glucosyltransferase/alpha-amylase
MSRSVLPVGSQRQPRSAGERRKTRPDWYKDAIIYEVRVRSFYDSDGDGLGDFRGLTEKLDYLQDLGVTALWLLPFYPSPLRDDGYDISEYTDVHPQCGTIDDFKVFLAEAHRRGLQVITELVLNHTSDQHPWFQRARRAPAGSPARDFYVWSDTADRYRDARIIFKDFEHSNWSWDPLARAYYWHRFYAHQPDLNFDNLAVHDALLSVVDFWFDLGIDGLRLDAVPYLYEREGTSSENLPETHAFLQKLRRHVDERYQGRMLLAEANQWPEDAAGYLGQGDECHMAFHFPIMPRLFMAIHLEDRFPLIDILAQTPALAETCQWALFLRNHDELTLEMVTDEERDYMYRAYARDQAMRINLGIRRRLAPLLGNDRRNMELMNVLLCSLPGTPVLYYGDEIGMGDNVFLGDRNGVRTPMQWSSDRNAGFSRANPQRLILPVIIDPEYHFEAINVEAQQNNPNSLLWWTKRLIALRKRFAAFGRGTIEFLSPDNHKVLAFIRRYGEEVILVVANLSRFVQFVELDLSRLRGRVPIELFGGNALPPIRELPYLLTLGGHAFYWFSLEQPLGADETSRVEGYKPPSIEVTGPWERVLEGAASLELPEVLAGYLASRPWFVAQGHAADRAGKAEPPPTLKAPAEDDLQPDDLTILEAIPVGEPPASTYLVIAGVGIDSGDADRYVLPIAFETEERAAAIRARSPQAIMAELHVKTNEGSIQGILIDPLADSEASRALLEALITRSRLRGLAGEVVAKSIAVTRSPSREDLQIEPRSLRVGQPSGAVVLWGEPFFLKLSRRFDEGTSTDLEVGRFLVERSAGPSVAPLSGFVEYRPDRGEPTTLAVFRRFTANEGDAFSRAVEEVGLTFLRVLTQRRDEVPLAAPDRSLLALSAEEPPAAVRELCSTWLDHADLLGQRTAELHLGLAGDTRAVIIVDPSRGEVSPPSMPPAFAPEPYTPFDQRSTYQSMRNQTGKVLRSLGLKLRSLSPAAVLDAESVLGHEAQVMKRFGALLGRRLTAQRTRYHGDYHLGNVLFTGKDFVIVDFEGDKRKTLPNRRQKGTVIRDLASMIRSFHYATMTALLDENRVRKEDRGALDPWAHLFYAWVSAAFLRGYFRVAAGAPFLPKEPRETEILLDAFLLKKAFNELGTELDAPSERVLIPLRGLAKMLAAPPPGGE